MGRDLMISKDKKMYVIQCKRWSVEKTIHEKHIFQLYGTTILQKWNTLIAQLEACLLQPPLFQI